MKIKLFYSKVSAMGVFCSKTFGMPENLYLYKTTIPKAFKPKNQFGFQLGIHCHTCKIKR